MKRILVVDDDWSILQLLKFTLTSGGYEVITANNAVEFEKAAFEVKPSLVILDIMLGNEDGTALYERFLAKGFDRRVPVIFLTALAQDRPPTLPKPGRTYSLMGKPFDTDALIKEIDCLLGPAQTQA